MAIARVPLFAARYLVCRSLIPAQTVLNNVGSSNKTRLYSSKAVQAGLPDTKEYKKEIYKMNRSFIGRFWDWLHTDFEQDDYEMGDTEKSERDRLLQRIQEMYFATPPVAPDLTVYKDAFSTLVKYNDRVGVENLWGLMVELGVEPDAELIELVDPFLEQARKNAWFE